MLSTMKHQPLIATSIIRFLDARGQPAMSVPFYQSKSGLPIGIKGVGKLGNEAYLRRLATQFAQALPWVQRQSMLAVMEAL